MLQVAEPSHGEQNQRQHNTDLQRAVSELPIKAHAGAAHSHSHCPGQTDVLAKQQHRSSEEQVLSQTLQTDVLAKQQHRQ